MLLGKEARWIIEGEAYFRESKIDLAAAKLLAGSTVPGMERRRLYLLQQALEKAVKSYMPLMVLAFRSSTRMAAYRMEFDEGKNLDQTASTILRERIERFAHRMTKPKDLGHDPAEKLQLKAFVENLYLYLQSMDLPKEEIAVVRNAIDSLEEKDISGLLSRIDNAERERIAVADKSLKRLEEEKPNVQSWMELVQVADEVLFPNQLNYMVEIVLYISLLSHLAKYEQAYRYPDQSAIPKQIFNNLDIIEKHIEKFVGYFELVFSNKEFLGLIDRMYFKQG